MDKQTITRHELSEKISYKHNMRYQEAYTFIDLTLEEIAKALEKDEVVKLPNFGVFFTRYKKERIGRNPKTLQEVKISARRVVGIRYCRSLRERIRQSALNNNKEVSKIIHMNRPVLQKMSDNKRILSP